MPEPREPLPVLVDATPPLPASFAPALAAALGALGLPEPGPDARAAIEGHLRLLLAWNPAINLTAVRDPVVAASVHIADSLAAVPWLRARPVPTLLDLGSGGGFPGLPLATMLPETQVTLLEATAKKARFLEVVVEAVGLADRVQAVNARAETVGRDRAGRAYWSVVTARAVASTADLVELAFPVLEPGGSLLAWKRGDLDRELEAARRAVSALGGGRLEVLPLGGAVEALQGHVLVVATRPPTGPAVPEAYPRDPAARTRRPW